MTSLIILLALAVIGLSFLLRTALLVKKELEETLSAKDLQYQTLLSQKKSSETRLGQITEQMAPFLANFPYDPKQAHFLGMPVDYVVFTDDEVVFLEVKSGQAVLSKRQQQIKDLILKGKVSWKEYRISGKVPILPIINARWDPDYWTTA